MSAFLHLHQLHIDKLPCNLVFYNLASPSHLLKLNLTHKISDDLESSIQQHYN